MAGLPLPIRPDALHTAIDFSDTISLLPKEWFSGSVVTAILDAEATSHKYTAIVDLLLSNAWFSELGEAPTTLTKIARTIVTSTTMPIIPIYLRNGFF